MSTKKDAPKTTKNNNKSDGFTDVERATMKELTAVEEAKIVTLIQKAVG